MLILLIALPLLTGLAAALPFPSRRGRLTFLLTMQIIETALVVWTLVSGRSYATNIWHLTESLTIAMKLDGVAAVFSALTAVAWLLALIYSVEYMSHSQNEARFYVFLFLSEGMLLGTALSADFVSMYVFYELTSLCSMPLVLHELTHDAVTGAMKYLYYSIGGAFFVLFGIVVLYTNTSTLDFAPGGTLIAGQHTGLELLAVFFVVLGFGTKAGLFPMHNWLPSAHPWPPAPASALLSGIITKAGRHRYHPGTVLHRRPLRAAWHMGPDSLSGAGTGNGVHGLHAGLRRAGLQEASGLFQYLPDLLCADGAVPVDGGRPHRWSFAGILPRMGQNWPLPHCRCHHPSGGAAERGGLPGTGTAPAGDVFVSGVRLSVAGRVSRPSGGLSASGPSLWRHWTDSAALWPIWSGGAAGIGVADGGIPVCSHRQRLLPRRGLRRGATAPGASGMTLPLVVLAAVCLVLGLFPDRLTALFQSLAAPGALRRCG